MIAIRRTLALALLAATAAHAHLQPATEPAGERTLWYRVDVPRYANGLASNDPLPGGGFAFPAERPWSDLRADEVESLWMAAESGEIAWPTPSSLRDRAVERRVVGGDLHGVLQGLERIAALGFDGVVLAGVLDGDMRVRPDVGGRGEGDSIESGQGWTRADAYLLGVLVPDAHRHGLAVVLELEPDAADQSDDQETQALRVDRMAMLRMGGIDGWTTADWSAEERAASGGPALATSAQLRGRSASLELASRMLGGPVAVVPAGLEHGTLPDPRHRPDAADAAVVEEFKRLMALRRDPVLGELLREGSVSRRWIDAGTEQDCVEIVARAHGPLQMIAVINSGTEAIDARDHLPQSQLQKGLTTSVEPRSWRWWLFRHHEGGVDGGG